MRNLLIIGATSAIAEATARRFAAAGARFYLIGRNAEKLAAIARDLEIRSGQSVHSESLDLICWRTIRRWWNGRHAPWAASISP